MKQYLTFASIGLLFLTLSNSCKKPKTIETKQIYNVEFPNKIGTTWKYYVQDQSYNTNDTVFVKIIGEDKFNDGKIVNIWEYSSSILYNNAYQFYRKDSDYVSSNINGIDIYEYKNAIAPKARYQFPLTVGKIWDYGFGNIEVKNFENHTVPLGNFNSYKLFDSTYIPFNSRIVLKEWFANNTGMIEKDLFLQNGGFIKQHWKLITFTP